MNLEIITWLMSALAFCGTILNSRRNKLGFIAWIITNGFFAIYNYCVLNCPSIGTLYIAYFILAVYGFFVWNKKEKNSLSNNKSKNKKSRKFYRLYRDLIETKNKNKE